VTAQNHNALLPGGTSGALPLWLVSEADFPTWLAGRGPSEVGWLKVHEFRPERGRVMLLPDDGGRPAAAVAGCGAQPVGAGVEPGFDPWLAAALAARLPPGKYALAEPLASGAATQFALGWLLGRYRYTRFRAPSQACAQLVEPHGADLRYAVACAEAIVLGRDLINAPPNLLGPAELEAAARAMAEATGGECRVVAGVELREGYPLIEAVGQGAAGDPARAPRLIELLFPRAGAPRVVLVGKGVCFDTGGLDIKPSAGMLLMKKDMGGAACVLALAQLLRRMEAPIDLRVLIPAVENSVDAAAFRPSDVYRSRKGLTVEVGNTDAEGRLVLADALHAASVPPPDLLIDLATLTGAARVALGTELPAVFSGDAELASLAQQCGAQTGDPLWQLPLWEGYDDDLTSRIADIGNVSSSGFAGAIIGALFLRRFVAEPRRWLHVDLYAWNARERPGRPLGGETQTIRALYALIRQRYG
jgi:leucyl aminopeptidase